MILAIDIGGDRLSYGFQLIINSIIAKYGNIVEYCSNNKLNSINISQYPIFLFSFMFVENYLHLIPVLKKTGIKLYAKDRMQIIIAGGSPISENPEPIADFLDICVIGEGEWVVLDILQILFKHKLNKDSALAEIYNDIDCAYVPKHYNPLYNSDERVISDVGRKVQTRREDINKAFDISGFYTRKGRGATRITEYSIEYHRGCKRKCKFCSYGHLQAPYREANHNLVRDKVEKVYQHDKALGNKVVYLQTNLFHVNIKMLELLKFYDKLNNYCSACIADMYTEKGNEILKYLSKHHNNIYLRFGIEDFTEEGRIKGGKPITDNQLINLPFFLDDRGRHIKFFFISSLPWQRVEDIHSFEVVMDKMSQRLSNYIVIECFITVLNYKLSAGLLSYNKRYNHEVNNYLTNGFKRNYGGGKLKLIICKNASEESFLITNLLSLANRKMAKVLIECSNNYSRSNFINICAKNMNINGLLRKYIDTDKLPNWYIKYD